MINQEIEKALLWRYAAKRFDATKKIDAKDWKTLMQSLIYAPSSYGLQPWKFLVIENAPLREQLKTVSWNQSQVTDASHLVVFASKEHITAADVTAYVNRIAEVRGVPADSLKGFGDMLVKNVVHGLTPEKSLNWTQRQAYIAMGFLLETAGLLKIDATPMEGLDPAAYDRLLGLEGTSWKTVASVALGYRHADDKLQHAAKVRSKEEHIIEYRR